MRHPPPDSVPVKVAILDTGIEAAHSAFVNANIVFRDFSGNARIPIDVHGHGTHCAGLIHELAPTATLFVGRVAERSGMFTYDSLWDALTWCGNEAVDLICLCTGGRHNDEDISRTIEQLAKQGVGVVAAVGNEGRVGGAGLFPASLEDVIAAACLDESDKLLPFVNQPDHVTLFGLSVDQAAGPWIGNRMVERGGTSVAASRLTGWLARALALHGRQSLQLNPKQFLKECSEVRIHGDTCYHVVIPERLVNPAL